jgi:hypothetical protein
LDLSPTKTLDDKGKIENGSDKSNEPDKDDGQSIVEHVAILGSQYSGKKDRVPLFVIEKADGTL